MTAIPEHMRAVVMTGVSQMEERTVPVPKPGPGEVLIRVHYSGINPVDFKNFYGYLAVHPTKLPASLGCDLSGVIVALGSGVTSLRAGDEVYGMTGGLANGPSGTLAEYAIAYAPMVLPRPASVTMREAAALPLRLLTGWEGLVERSKLRAGQTVLITGGTGGVGQLLIQVALAKGAHTFATGSVAKRHLVEKLGATFIDYKGFDAAAVKKMTPGGNGFDVIYDTFGGEVLSQMAGVIAPLGSLSTCSGIGSYDISAFTMLGSTINLIMVCEPYFTPSRDEKVVQHFHKMFMDANELVAAGKVKPVVDARVAHLTKADVLETFEALKASKVIIVPVIEVLKH